MINEEKTTTVGKVIVINPGHWEECYPVYSKDFSSFGKMLDHVVETRVLLEKKGFSVTTRDINKTLLIARKFHGAR